MDNVKFPRTKLHEPFAAKRIISLHYFEFAPDFVFEGEKHDFWELVYVDKGELEVFADMEGYCLKQGDMIFHKPDEFHGVWANRKVAPNVIIVSFDCHSPEMEFFQNKIFSLSQDQRELLALLMKNTFAAFLPPYGHPRDHTLRRRPDAPVGSEQRIKLYLELLLLDLYQEGGQSRREQRLSGAIKTKSEQDLAKRMADYMEQHLLDNVSLEQIYRHFNLSKSHALALFKKTTGQTIMKYYRGLRIEHAKRLIREERHSFTEIAELLQYNSVHNFSRHFRSETDMSPSEYARTLKANQ